MPHPKVVVVTGASAGIGRATARAFAVQGADVALLARGEAGLAGARREIETLGQRALSIAVDVADAEQVDAAAERIERELGPIDVWVNNAMVTILSPFMNTTPDEYRRVTDVTYLGTVYGTRAALKRMQARNRGTIVQVGSALAYRAIPLQAPYCGAKFAIRGFTDALRSELQHDHVDVRITMVQLCAFNTPQFDWARIHFAHRPEPVPPIYQPEVAAQAIVWAARRGKREVWVGAPTWRTILAQQLAPGLLDRLAAHFGYSRQITAEPLPPNYRDNLFTPVEQDHGAHGRFDAQAYSGNWSAWRRRRYLYAAATIGSLAWLVGKRLTRNPQPRLPERHR